MLFRSSERASKSIAESVITADLQGKKFVKGYLGEVDGFESLRLKFTAVGLDKPARSIKGVLHFNDLFGDPQFSMGWTIKKPLNPGQSYVEKAYGFNWNSYSPEMQWVRNNKLEDMKTSLEVESILYTDGTRLDF